MIFQKKHITNFWICRFDSGCKFLPRMPGMMNDTMLVWIFLVVDFLRILPWYSITMKPPPFGNIWENMFSKTVSKHRGQANQSFGAGGKRRNFIDNSHSVWRMMVHPLIHTHHQHARIIPTLCPDTQGKINMFVCLSYVCVYVKGWAAFCQEWLRRTGTYIT